MNAVQVSDSTHALSSGQRTALVKLLSDEDPAIYQLVKEKILSLGCSSREWMQPHLLSSDPLLRRRVQELVDHMDRQEADNRFLSFCVSHGDDLDLETGTWLLARTRYPHTNPEAYSALLDSYAGDLRERIDFGSTTDQILGAINQYLFTELGFSGNEENYYDPDNSYLNRVIDRRTGNPISLCLIYLFLARRLQLPIAGIGMPGHFLCRFQSTSSEIYIDAFNKGKLLARADCVRYLLQTSHGFQESHLAAVTPLRMLLRICSNLHQIYVHLLQSDESARLQHYIVALAK